MDIGTLREGFHLLFSRQSNGQGGKEDDSFLGTIGQSTSQASQAFTINAIFSSLTLALAAGGGLTILFCLIRPHHNVVYAPRAKYADSKHAPPPVPKGLFTWLGPLWKTKESEVVQRMGLDAAVFLRVSRMLSTIFALLAVLAIGILVPVNVIAAKATGFFDKPATSNRDRATQALTMMAPTFLYMRQDFGWAYVLVAWLFDLIICGFLWMNYRVILRLRREYFNSPEYRQSLHSRTLMLTDIPTQLRSDEGINRIVDAVGATNAVPRASIARNVKELPDLVEQHESTVKSLEKVLAKYLRNPDKLPARRPVCKVSSKDKSNKPGTKVDAIEYLTARIKLLEQEIRDVRETVDKRNALPFGFASYPEITDAHSVAYAARKKAPNDTNIALAPQPKDLIWTNLAMLRSTRRWRNIINGFWIALLTGLFVIPNTLIAVFLSNLANLGKVWPAFQRSLDSSPGVWGVVQGILSPAISFFVYLFLPVVFRRLRVKAGDVTKSSRERHVTSALFTFFVFNQFIVFSFFSVVWSYVAMLIAKEDITTTNAASKIVGALAGCGPYWISYMLQRNLGASIDLIQLLRLTYGSFQRRFLSPTPREQIEASAPQPFDYASYYNYLLFYSTVAFVMAPIQPIMLLIAAYYFSVDSLVKKYMLMYIFITKYESGGMFWRTIFNRVLVFTLLGNLVFVLIILTPGNYMANLPKLATLGCLPLLLLAFKFYCLRTFDDAIHYYRQGRSLLDAESADSGAPVDLHKAAKRDKVAVRFGNPVLYRPLITPMVSAKSQHLLKSIYSGRTSLEIDPATTGGYSDVYLDNMDARKPGKSTLANSAAPFEIVNESDMDFENFKNRAEFREAAGGDGQLFGQAADHIRPGTPSSTWTGLTRTGSMGSDVSAPAAGHFRDHSNASSYNGGQHGMHTRDSSRGSDSTRVGGGPYQQQETEYPRGYHQTPSALREHSPAGSSDFGGGRRSASTAAAARAELSRQASQDALVSSAAGMGMSAPFPGVGSASGGRANYSQLRNGGGYYTPDAETPGESPPAQMRAPMGGVGNGEDTSYDYFRRGRGPAR